MAFRNSIVGRKISDKLLRKEWDLSEELVLVCLLYSCSIWYCTCTVDYPRRTSRPIVRISAAGLDFVSSHQLVILIHINHTRTVSWFPTLSLIDCQFYWCCVFIRRARNSFTDLQLFRFNGRAFHFSATL